VRYNQPLKGTWQSKGQKGYTHAMHRIPPSQKIGKKIDELLRQGLDGEEDVTTAIILCWSNIVIRSRCDLFFGNLLFHCITVGIAAGRRRRVAECLA